MNDSQLRALIGAILYNGDCAANEKSTSWEQERYLQRAQFLLESSYKNYQPPTGGDQQEVDRAMSLLVTKGYYITSPGDASTPPPLPVVSEQPPLT